MIDARGRLGPYLFLGPAILYLAIWVYYPIAKNFYLSFFTAGASRSDAPQFVGLANYQRLLSDDLFFRALMHNLAWVALSIVIPVVIGLVLAVLLVERRARLFYAAVFFLPVTVAPIMAAIVWGWIYNPTFGALNQFLAVVGLGGLAQPWLADPATALVAVNMIGSWGYYGFCALIFLAGLQGIDPEIYDAARIDGANSFRRFWSITLPLLKPTLVFVLVYTIIGSMKFFDIIYVATKGGPDNSTQIVAVYMFDLFIRQGEQHYAAAMSMVLTAIILVMSLLVIRNATRRT
ncbi:MAG: sugar ABC transporter permease [Bauldia sp.]|nr:sugar ABC transporter permease [Bauldia sp.]